MPEIVPSSDVAKLDKWRIDMTATIVDPPTCAEAMNVFKERLAENHEGLAELLGDKNLLKFLRYKDYDGEAAFNMITMINDYRINYPERWIPEGKGPRDYAYVYNLRSIEILRHRNPIDGSAIVVLRMGDWRPETGVDFSQGVNAGLFLADCVLNDERIQRDGVTLIIDCRGQRVSWLMRLLPPSQIPSTITYAQDACPIKFIAVHILHQPILYTLLYGIVWPFLSGENQQKIYIHGRHIEKMHKYVDRSILPKDLRGPLEPDYFWLAKIAYENHDDMAKRIAMQTERS